MMCAGYEAGITGNSCEGDSGGPLVFFNSGQQIHVQLGVVTGGVCQSKNVPGAFVRLEDQSIWDFIQLYAFGKNVIGYDDLKTQIESLKSMKGISLLRLIVQEER